jgi:hypothetical protein
MIGNARPEKYMIVPAGSFRLGAAAPGIGTEGTFSTLLFSNVRTESAYYNVHIPADWDTASDMKVAVYWTPTSSAGGGVAWEIDYESVASEANETLGAGSIHMDMHDVTQGLDNELLETGYGTMFSSNIEVDDTIGLHLYRDHDDGDDSYGADAALIHIEIEYDAGSLGA